VRDSQSQQNSGKSQIVQTVDKAMGLMSFFSAERAHIGLNELSRLAGLDRAATRRYLLALSKHGLIEQGSDDKKYRLGSGLLRLARVREATVPFVAIVRPVLDQLATELQETAHACLYSEGSMSTIAIAEPDRATRVYVSPTQPLPLHATASGLAYLAHLEDEEIASLLKKLPLEKHTARTATRKRDISARLVDARKKGFARGERIFEEEVIGTAAPIFDASGKPVATIAVAAVATRFTRELDGKITKAVLMAAASITKSIGGEVRA
jgi:IclR family transcriptional regulator, acetate operon repressor